MERLDFVLEGQADQAKLELQFMDTVNNFAHLYSRCNTQLANGTPLSTVIGELRNAQFADNTTKLNKMIKEIEENEKL